jgi:hypothetical protein
MIIPLIYLISLASAAGALLLWRVYRLLDARTRTKVLLFIRKQLLYQLVYRRRNGSDDVSVLSLFNICLLVGANITACALKIQDRGELARRCGRLFLVNMIPLFLGGKRSLLADQILRIHSSEQSLLHRWMGRVCVLQGVIHATISTLAASPTAPQITVSVTIYFKEGTKRS